MKIAIERIDGKAYTCLFTDYYDNKYGKRIEMAILSSIFKSKKVKSGIMNHAKNLWEFSESLNYMGGTETFGRWSKMKICEMLFLWI